jgi:hypothetical protein
VVRPHYHDTRDSAEPDVDVSAVTAEDVTIFLAGQATSIDIADAVASITFLGATPISVDEAGATHYAYSRIVSDIGRGNQVTTETGKRAP